MTIFFTSDEHYQHTNVLKYCNRPFDSIEDMNAALIWEHNQVVGENDTVYHLGDFTFRKVGFVFDIVRQLNGTHVFIHGNHDTWCEDVAERPRILAAADVYFGRQKIKDIQDYLEIKVGSHIVLHHFPLLTWHKSYKGSLMLHGHCHSSINEVNERADVKRLDVGVDSAYKYFGEYRPFKLSEVQTILRDRVGHVPDGGRFDDK